MNTNKNHESKSRLQPLPVTSDALEASFNHYLTYYLGHNSVTLPDYAYNAISLTLRDRIMANWSNTNAAQTTPGVRRAYYVSLEFLIGRALGNHLLNMDIKPEAKGALESFAVHLEDAIEAEPDAGLGNGGLGRLAACFLDSCATLQLPVTGYGIRYQYGMFRQEIINGYQDEEPDHWLRDGNPWEIERAEDSVRVKFGGRTEYRLNDAGVMKAYWLDTRDVVAIPYDMPVTGYQNTTVNTLRLWQATATDEFNLDEFNAGSYTDSVGAKNSAENISMVLYPNDTTENGKELRLKQQYFLASASIQDVIRQWEMRFDGKPDYSTFADDNVFQMNDTHPTISVAELMRILMDEKCMSWDAAWTVVTKSLAYTNHTLLPEALEKWSVGLFEKLLPRLLDIIYEINSRFLRVVAQRWPADTARLARMSIIEEGPTKFVRMAHLAIVGSFSTNGVAALHSELLKKGLFHDFYELWPEKFNNKTNGVTPRRWIAHANPMMTELITSKIGDGWIRDLSQIEQLAPFADVKNTEFRQNWKAVKQANKTRLADLIKERIGVEFNPEAMFDVQVKRIHEYKRQLLNVLHVIHLYSQIKNGKGDKHCPRCVLIGGKAAPGYELAKDIIKLINNVAEVINNDKDIGDQLKLAFLPNYNVSSMEIIAPGADLSEQISTAGKEASGTGNMKFMMNGALTIGTYDGANIEIMDAVGEENFFLFGLRENEVADLRGNYRPYECVDHDEDLKDVISLLQCGHFNANEPGIFDNIISSLLNFNDPWMTLADFRSYVDAQEAVAAEWKDQESWITKSILNSARSGFFSTDRTMESYNEEIWKLEKVTT
ncbi:glycogen/starch/alpha-glucan phosphorylase [Leucothrix arctica]|uniref:Alpha-1,4 glucan phosphorylase n=1 Tax=Leucothrix arctica TaxID=1481894 RepID=A0A317C583_9GAMM|nr:glycogen/starch/alpha-glucan phosphorylase [Leucothrix arctica]PWQ93457.1 glycogen phosphorylase [Leucothrix arctica]